MKNSVACKLGASQQNPQAQTLIWIIQIAIPIYICTLPQAQFNNSHKTLTHTLIFGSLLQASPVSKIHPHSILLGFPSLRTVPYSNSIKSLKDGELFICLSTNLLFAEDFLLQHLQETACLSLSQLSTQQPTPYVHR